MNPSRFVAISLHGLSVLSPYLLGCDEESKKTEAAPSAPAVPAPWPAGQGADYTFGLSSRTQVGKMPAKGTLEVTGKVSLVAESLDEGKLRLHFHPSELELLQPSNVGEEVEDDFRGDFGQPFAVELQDGVLEVYLEPEESSLMAFGLRRQLMALSQRVDPKSTHEANWSGKEWDASGLAQVKYALNPSQEGTYAWEKTGYVKVLANRAAESALQEQSWKPQIAASEGSIEIDETGVVVIERKETLQTELMPEQFLQTSYRAKLRRLTGWHKEKAPTVEDLERRKVDSPPPKMDTSSLDAIRFAGRTWEEVLASLPQEEETKGKSAKTDFRARQAAFHAIVGLLRTDHENVEKAKKLIDAKDPRSSTLMRCLAAASTKETLGVLAKMSLDASRPMPERQAAAAMLLRAEKPPAEILDTLVKYSKIPEMEEFGLLGLGTFSRRWRIARNKETATKAAGLISQALASAKTTEEKKSALLAVANSGDASLFEQAKALQSSDDPEVREAAIHAVRLMMDNRVEPLLTSLLKKATTPSEIVTIVTALEHRKTVKEATVALVESKTKPELDASVRRRAAIALGQWRKQWPRVVQVLDRLAASDPDARVREAAQIGSM